LSGTLTEEIETMKNIDQVEIDDIVTNGYEVAKVTECVHGNKFYALIGDAPDGIEPTMVSDMDESHVDECCG